MSEDIESWLYRYPPLSGTNIGPKDLPKDILDPKHKELVLKKKKKYKWHSIGEMIWLTILVPMLLYYFSYIVLYDNDELLPIIFIAVLVLMFLYGLIQELVQVPKRIKLYKQYNFERTCYAIVSSKFYKRHKTTQKGRTKITYTYHVNLQINENQHIKSFTINSIEYEKLIEGDKVIVVSFDGYKSVLVYIDEKMKYYN